MLDWFFRFEAYRDITLTGAAQVDAFPFFGEAVSAGLHVSPVSGTRPHPSPPRPQEEEEGQNMLLPPPLTATMRTSTQCVPRTIAEDTTHDLYPTRTWLLSRRVFLETFSTIQTLFAFYTLALWNYLGVVRLGGAMSSPLGSTNATAIATSSHSHSKAVMATAYLALALVGLVFTTLTTIAIAMTNGWSGRPSLGGERTPADAIVEVTWASPLPRFAFPTVCAPLFDEDSYEEETAHNKARLKRQQPVKDRATSGTERGPSMAPPLPRQMQQEVPLVPPPRSRPRSRPALTISIPLPQIHVRPRLRRQRHRPSRVCLGKVETSFPAGHQREQQFLLYLNVAVVATLTALDIVAIAETAVAMTGRASEEVVVHFTVVQFMTPLLGLVVSLYTLRWAVAFVFTSSVRWTQNTLSRMFPPRG